MKSRLLWHSVAFAVYFLICFFDFIIFPLITLCLKLPQWQPLTLQGAGVFHMAFCGLGGVGTWAYHKTNKPPDS